MAGYINKILLCLILPLTMVIGVIQQNGCKTQVDIVVVVDQSNRISQNDYDQIRKFIVDLSRSFGISQQSTHISLVLAYHDSDVVLHLDEATNGKIVERLAEQLPQFRDPYIQLGKALRLTRQEINGPRSRLLAKKVVLILTNGNSQDGFLDEAIALIKETDQVYAIGFGEFLDTMALSVLASSSHGVYIINPGVNSGDKLEKISHNVMDIICRSCYIDVCFVIDASTVSNNENLAKIKNIMQTYIKVFLAGEKVRFAIVEAIPRARVLLRLDSVLPVSLLTTLVTNLDYSDFGGTKPSLGEALAVVKDDVFHASSKLVKKAVVIFTDGHSLDSPESTALMLKSSGTYLHVYSFGTDLYTPYLVSMATDGRQGNMHANSVDAAEEKALKMRASLCGGCQDRSIFCTAMSLWGLCKNLKTKEKCPASCQVCYKKEVGGWMQKWIRQMRIEGPMSNLPFKMNKK